MERIGWIGLGLMGSRMLPHLLRAGHPATIYDREASSMAPLIAAGASSAASPAEVAATSEVVFSLVATPADVEAVYFGNDGLLAGATPGSVLVDMTSSSVELARRIAAAGDAAGISVLDAPVSGGTAGAEMATLSIMIGGHDDVLARVRPILERLGTTIVYQGPIGAGQSAKIANQIALGGAMIGICEAFLFARASGLRPELVLEALSAGVAGSDLLRYIWPRLAAGDLEPGFRVEHFIKDLGLALEAGHDASVALPGTALVRELYCQVSAVGWAGKGTQSLIVALDPRWGKT